MVTPVSQFDDINAAINIKKFALQDQSLAGVIWRERAIEPVDSLPLGRRMIAGKPRPRARGVHAANSSVAAFRPLHTIAFTS
ncbi:MAG: hypothetical protein RQM90_08040 [Methanoculleus sp.]